MANSLEIQRLRQQSGNDDSVYRYLYGMDTNFRNLADSYKSAMPNMSALAQAKFSSAMLNKYSLGSFNPQKTKDSMFVQSAVERSMNPVMPRIHFDEEKRSSVALEEGLQSPSKFAGGLVSNIFSSGLRYFNGIYQTVRHPIQSLKGIGKAALGGVLNTAEVLADNEDLFDDPFGSETLASSIGQFYKDRYGSLDAAKKTAYEDPVGFTADLATVLSLGGGLLRAGVRGATAAAPSVSTSGIAATLGRAGTTAVNVGKAIDPFLNLTKAAGKVASVISPGRLVTSAVKLTPVQAAAFKNKVGVPYEKWILAQGLTGSADDIGKAAERIADVSQNMLDDVLNSVDELYKLPKAAASAGEEISGIERVAQALKTIADNTDEVGGLEGLHAHVMQLQTKLMKEGLTLTEVNGVKRLLDQNTNIFNRVGDVRGGFVASGLAKVRYGIKSFIEEQADVHGLEDVAEINKMTQAGKELSLAIAATVGRRGANNVLSLTDYILGAGLGVGQVGLGVILGKHLLGSQRMKIALAHVLSLLSTDEYYLLQRAAQTGEMTSKTQKILRNVVFHARDVARQLPEIPPAAIVPLAETAILPQRLPPQEEEETTPTSLTTFPQ